MSDPGSADLLFALLPTAQPPASVDLLFGEAEAAAVFQLSLNATLGDPTFTASANTIATASLVAAMPDLTFSATGSGTTLVELIAALPAPSLTAAITTVTNVDLVAELPPLTASLTTTTITLATFAGSLPGLAFAATAVYDSNTSRPTVGQTATDWQVATPYEFGRQARHQTTARLAAGQQAFAQQAVNKPAGVQSTMQDSTRTPSRVRTGFQQGARAQGKAAGFRWQEADRSLRVNHTGGFQQGIRAPGKATGFRWQEAIRTERKSAAGRWQVANAKLVGHGDQFSVALPFPFGREGVFQEAMRPPPGRYVRPVQPGEGPCYLPPLATAVALLFSDGPGTTNLVYVCERHSGGVRPPPPPPEEYSTVTVPVKRVYMVLNNATLVRLDGNISIPTLSMSLTLDYQSFTWGFSASLPGQAESSIEPGMSGDPVIVEATVNGVGYRMVIESMARERTFGKSSIRIGGRGISSLLDAPYSPIMNFGNTESRTAQQLFGDVLTINGVPMDWETFFYLDDWNVPTGAFSAQGTYMAALNQIAKAAGGYVQPHPSLQQIKVYPLYPYAPWDWDTAVTPHYVLPSSVTTREGIERVEKPIYNRVYVSGTNQGVLGMVTRAGTAGDLVAPMVTDALITEAPAARQRGLSILADTGKQAKVSLRLPVLAETGIIVPGKFIDYTDGSITRRGLVRGVSVDVGRPDIFQTLQVETHANP